MSNLQELTDISNPSTRFELIERIKILTNIISELRTENEELKLLIRPKIIRKKTFIYDDADDT